MNRTRPVRVIGVLVVGVAALASSCSVFSDDASTQDPTTRPDSGEDAETGEGAESEPDDQSPSRIRDDDELDPIQLATDIASPAGGDEQWIEIVSELTAQSWLIARYPGDYEATKVFDEQWVAEVVAANETDAVDNGTFIDEPLPELLSVRETRQLGELVEVEVVLAAGEATIRRANDDSAIGTFPAGEATGLFMLGQSGEDQSWRIHSIVELGPGS